MYPMLRAFAVLYTFTLCSDCTVNVSITIERQIDVDIDCLAATSNPHSLAWNVMQFEASSFHFVTYIDLLS